MNLELQARSCEFGQLLRPELGELRKGMLDRMPVADEETVRNRRARFRNEDKGADDSDEDDDDDDEGRGLPSFRISKASKHRRGGSGSGSGAAAASARAARAALGAGKKTVQPLAGPAASAGGILSSGGPSRQEQAAAVPNLLDLDDLFGGGPGDSAAAAAAPGGEGKAATVDLMADIFAAKPAQPPAAAGVVDPFAPTPAPATAANGSGGGVAATLAAAAAAAAAAPGREAAPAITAAATSGQPPPPSFVAFEKGGLTVTFELSKPSPAEDPSTTLVKAIFRNSGASDVTGLHFQAAVPKYLRLEMQPASGSVVKAGGAGAVEQVVRITNSLQGQKNLLMKLKLVYEVGGAKMQEMASVGSFPPGY
ncbi:unnamed protein product [Ectocarpus sp. 13 AM-2016]